MLKVFVKLLIELGLECLRIWLGGSLSRSHCDIWHSSKAENWIATLKMVYPRWPQQIVIQYDEYMDPACTETELFGTFLLSKIKDYFEIHSQMRGNFRRTFTLQDAFAAMYLDQQELLGLRSRRSRIYQLPMANDDSPGKSNDLPGADAVDGLAPDDVIW